MIESRHYCVCENCKYMKVMNGCYCSMLDDFTPFDGYCSDWRASHTRQMKEQIEQIADAYEFTHQAVKLFEEMGELQQAVAKVMLDDGPMSEFTADLSNVTEELADTLIMLWQIIYLLDIDSGTLKQTIESKLDRQINRMEDENHGT